MQLEKEKCQTKHIGKKKDFEKEEKSEKTDFGRKKGQKKGKGMDQTAGGDCEPGRKSENRREKRRGSLLWQHPEIPSTITEGAVLEVVIIIIVVNIIMVIFNIIAQSRGSLKCIILKVAKKAASRKNVVARSLTVTHLTVVGAEAEAEKEETCSAPTFTTSPYVSDKVGNVINHDHDHGHDQVHDVARDRSYSLPSSCTTPLPINYKALRDRSVC